MNYSITFHDLDGPVVSSAYDLSVQHIHALCEELPHKLLIDVWNSWNYPLWRDLSKSSAGQHGHYRSAMNATPPDLINIRAKQVTLPVALRCP